MFKNTKISNKLILTVIIPIFGLVYFTIASTFEKRNIVHNMNLLEALSELAVKSTALIHELQNERGMSAGFIGSQGSTFSNRIKQQRAKTDNAIKKFNDFVKNFNFTAYHKEIKYNLDTIFLKLNTIETQRNLVDKLDILLEEQMLYYTEIIDSLLTGINHLSNILTHAELYNRVVAYLNLLQTKENISIERAILNNVFSTGHFAPGMYRRAVLLAGMQKTYIKNFFFFATHRQKKIYRDIMMQNQHLIDEVERIRKVAFKKASKFQLLRNLHSHLGYGGLFHQLSEYILWGEQKYINSFYQQYKNASILLEIYKNLPYLSQLDIENLRTIENTFNSYNGYLAKIIEFKQEQSTVKKESDAFFNIDDEMDAIIEIDDAIAIKALNSLLSDGRLDVKPNDWWNLVTQKINLLKTVEYKISSDLKQSIQFLKKEAQDIFIFYLFIMGATILLTLFLSYLSIRSITNPLKALVTVANQISSGNRDLDISINSKEETGQLSKAMKQMLGSINRSEVILKDTNQAYARFVPNEFLELLNKDQIIDIQLGNHLEMTMTVLFSDIRAFTTLSEKMSPQESFDFINAYLRKMGPIIRENNGFIDKYIGDAIMALFINADDALKAAMTMQHDLLEFNEAREHQGFPVTKIGIGINTGELMLGIIGEQNRLQCTVISDAVNVASRVESLTKTYKTSLIISESTYKQLTEPSRYVIRFLDNIKVKGRSERVKLFAVEKYNGLGRVIK
jgi:class 3 adenylate cyclase/HAMP domain-containing protein